MHRVHALAALAFTSFTFAALGAPDSSKAPADSNASTQLACGGPGANCTGDVTCGRPLVCDAHCPVIPGRLHCEIAGGVCEPRCTETGG